MERIRIKPIVLIFFVFLLIFHSVFVLAVYAANYDRNKIVLICLDGASWGVMEPLLKENQLPHFRELIKGGVSGKLFSEFPFSPPAWTSIATAKSPQKHGVFEYSDSRNRKARYVWSILSDFNLKVVVLGWKMALPEKINGFMYLPIKHYEKRIDKEGRKEYYPAGIEEEARKKVKIKESLPFNSENLVKDRDNFDENLVNMSKFFLGKLQPDFVAMGFEGADEYQHFFWSSLQPEHFDTSIDEVTKRRKLINNYYKKIDKYLHYFMKNNYTIILVSDHGFTGNDTKSGLNIVKFKYRSQDRYKKLLINQMLERLGLLTFITGFRGGRIDFALSKAYFYNNINTGLKGLKINKRIVAADQFDSLKERLYQLISRACFETKDKVFADVKKYESSKNIDNPDIIFKLSPVFKEKNAVFEDWQGEYPPFELAFKYLLDNDSRRLTKILLEDTVYDLAGFIGDAPHSGIHDPDGVIIMAGKKIRKNEQIKAAKTTDITATILYLFGLPTAKDMDGKVLTQAIEPEFLKKHPVASVETYETNDKEFYLKDFSKEEINYERLRALGYMQ